jgi:hypothetical protein
MRGARKVARNGTRNGTLPGTRGSASGDQLVRDFVEQGKVSHSEGGNDRTRSVRQVSKDLEAAHFGHPQQFTQMGSRILHVVQEGVGVGKHFCQVPFVFPFMKEPLALQGLGFISLYDHVHLPHETFEFHEPVRRDDQFNGKFYSWHKQIV